MPPTTTSKITYRKTKAGEWVAFGPVYDIVHAADYHDEVVITKANGTTKTETIVRHGRPFMIGGVEMCYGYIGKAVAQPARGPSCGGDCWSFGVHCWSCGS